MQGAYFAEDVVSVDFAGENMRVVFKSGAGEIVVVGSLATATKAAGMVNATVRARKVAEVVALRG